MTAPKNDRLNWQVSLADPLAIVEGIEDIAQCVYTILSTIPGSDPLRPEFGSGLYQYLDKPLAEVRAKIVYAATEAIERWEPRLEVTRCIVSRTDSTHTIIKIEGKVVGSANQITVATTL